MKKLILIYGLLIALGAYSQEKKRNVFIPNLYTLQFAGSIGFGSIGAGYASTNDRFNLSLGYGYVPKSLGGRLDILHAKLVYKPFAMPLGNKLIWKPANPVFFLSYTINEGFYGNWPEHQYPKDYYWWNSAYRLHGGLSSELSIPSAPQNKLIKNYTFYVEANTNDLYLASYLTNRNYLTIYDILKLGMGIKVNLL